MNENEELPETQQVIPVEQDTAFYLENMVQQYPGFPVRDVYMNSYTNLKELFQTGVDSRMIAILLAALAHDVMSVTCAITDYQSKDTNPNGFTVDQDMENFIKTVTGMMMHISDGVGNNAALLLNKKSIFLTKEKKADA